MLRDELNNLVQKRSQKALSEADDHEIYGALLEYTKEKLDNTPVIQGSKKLYYISAEFLIGKLLSNNLINLGLYDQVKEELTRSVREFIRENFTDQSLNASMIAGYLNMNLSTLSHQYKAAAGCGLLDELHAVRLENAKKLLSEGASVKEAAERSGYADQRALIRAFKRYEGMTPGQYAKSGPAR